MILEDILQDNFMEYREVYKKADEKGMTKNEVKAEKDKLGIKTITLVNGDERLWLWYIPKNVWNKFSLKQ
ncbi:hypothetical protein CLHOM_02970 [Clostridium homopropionicum DSM 5847]|uniref:Uncharacterized protein n=1 Tax=Clostridium homopropionicum DSM 5847 TaxID=1121318 RepID=A0A0L6ZDY5_9CLOT|nr:hypothetical protein [Clostridium homopropionicum]KOA21167.1 hypothetical protein CLHOM_02970 [Clostridium homopropionicum DSM 5847]SFG25861.1 hypothetical protein SAMN04488501_10738 [Clostridium homopropionicum]